MLRSLFACMLLLQYLHINAQTAHYWTESYGTRSMLLNGVVVGSVEDLGAVYYNPARLSQFETPAFVISGKVYQLNRITIENGLGDGLDLKKSNFGGGPSMVSGTFKIGFLKKHQFAYAFLTRTQSDNTFNFAVEEYGDFVEGFPGEEYFSGEISSSDKINDEWMGLSWSYPISDKWSIGVTGFYSNLERGRNLRLQLQAYSIDSAQTAIYIDKRAYSYTSQSILAKIGIGYQSDRVSLGLTITTPKYQGIGEATTSFETFLTGIDTTQLGTPNETYIINNQGGIENQHKSPFSIAAGAGIKLGEKGLLHASAQYFTGISSYTILQSEEFIGQSSGESYQMTVKDELSPVLNFGLGLEFKIMKDFSMFGSFATDYAALTSNVNRITELQDAFSDNAFKADIYHFGFGTDIKTKFANLTLGATYARSREAIERNFSIGEGANPVTDDARVLYNRWRFLIGFEFKFIDSVKEKLKLDKK